jgi:rubrerythrin
MFQEGPIRRLLRGQVSEEREYMDLLESTADAIPSERDAHDLYVRLASIARELNQPPEIAAKFEEIAVDEADHLRIIRDEILPAIRARSK